MYSFNINILIPISLNICIWVMQPAQKHAYHSNKGNVMMIAGNISCSQQEDISIFTSMNVVYYRSICHYILWMVEILFNSVNNFYFFLKKAMYAYIYYLPVIGYFWLCTFCWISVKIHELFWNFRSVKVVLFLILFHL